MDKFDLWMHTYTPTIEVWDMQGTNLINYQSLIIPRIGDEFYWEKDGIKMSATVVNVVHEIIKGETVNCCRRVYANVDNIIKM